MPFNKKSKQFFDGGMREIPNPLIEQLGEGGRLVAPVGDEETQKLVVLTKKDGEFIRRELVNCKFVPLIGKFGWPETV